MGTTSQALDRAMADTAGFLGTVPVDRLPKRLKQGESVIVNLQTSFENGSHWVCAKRLKEVSVYFDPFGGQPDDRVLALLHRSGGKAYVSTGQYQDKRSDRCGAYCVFVLRHLNALADLYPLLYDRLTPSASRKNERAVAGVMADLQAGTGLSAQDAADLGQFALDFVQNPVLASITKGVEVIGSLYNGMKAREQAKATYALQKRREARAQKEAYNAQARAHNDDLQQKIAQGYDPGRGNYGEVQTPERQAQMLRTYGWRYK